MMSRIQYGGTENQVLHNLLRQTYLARLSVAQLAVRRGCACSGCSGVGSLFAVPCGNCSVGGAGGGVEELTIQVKWFSLMH